MTVARFILAFDIPLLRIRGGQACPPNKFFGRRGELRLSALITPLITLILRRIIKKRP
jgi:hypothetical protein